MVWAKGDPLTATNLNSKTRDIISQPLVGGNNQYKKRTLPDLVFRQEGSSFPPIGSKWPRYWCTKPFRIIGITGYYDDELLPAPTFTLKAFIDRNDGMTAPVDVFGDLPETLFNTPDLKFPDSALTPQECLVYAGNYVYIETTALTDIVEQAQFNIIIRMQ